MSSQAATPAPPSWPLRLKPKVVHRMGLRASGADDGIRTRDPHLGKVVLLSLRSEDVPWLPLSPLSFH
jgi:hypothetical protein